MAEHNGNGNGNGGNGWQALIAKYGVQSAIALFLIWWLTGKVDGELGSMKATLTEHTQVTNAATLSMQNFSAEQRQVQRELSVLLRQICVNTAKTDQARQECIR